MVGGCGSKEEVGWPAVVVRKLAVVSIHGGDRRPPEPWMVAVSRGVNVNDLGWVVGGWRRLMLLEPRFLGGVGYWRCGGCSGQDDEDWWDAAEAADSRPPELKRRRAAAVGRPEADGCG